VNCSDNYIGSPEAYLSQWISFAMAQARLQGYLSKHSRTFTSPTCVTPARPTKWVPLQDIMEETQSTDDDYLVSCEEWLSPINSLCASTQLQLSFSDANPSIESDWSMDELKAFVQFVLENGRGNVWATHQSAKVWSAVATFIQRKVGTTHIRTSTYYDVS